MACSSKDSPTPSATPPVASKDAKTESAAQPAKDKAMDEATITSGTELASNDNKVVTLIGVYEVDNLGKRRIASKLPDGTEVVSNKAVYVKLEDDVSVRIGARPDAEHADFAGKTVKARGKLLANGEPPDPRASQMKPMPTLVEVESIEPSE